jgi:transcriptional regulator with XRE-family HTH domain
VTSVDAVRFLFDLNEQPLGLTLSTHRKTETTMAIKECEPPDKTRFTTLLNLLVLIRGGERDKDVADRLGIERGLFSKVRNGRIRELPINIRRKLAAYYGIKEDHVTDLVDRRALMWLASDAFIEGTPMPSDPFETKAE